jgi:hypothetical protein
MPVRDAAGGLHSLQFIAADGAKRFLTGGRKKGCFYVIGEPNGELHVVEGFATGATVLEDTGHAAAICFDGGNLPAAAKELRGKFSDLRFIVCTDDDIHRPNNPGLTHGREAAAILGASIAVPDFGENRPANASDFNDLHQHAGSEAGRACIGRAMPIDYDDGAGQPDPTNGSGGHTIHSPPRSPFIMKPNGLYWQPCIKTCFGGLGSFARRPRKNTCFDRGLTSRRDKSEPIRNALHLIISPGRAMLHGKGVRGFLYGVRNILSAAWEPAPLNAQGQAIAKKIINLAGYRKMTGDAWDYYFTPGGWREACAGLDPRTIAKALAERGLLDAEDDRHLAKHFEGQ